MGPPLLSRLLTKYLPLLFVFLILNGCQSLSYYHQAIAGHSGILLKRESISNLIAADTTPEELKQQLILVSELLIFAEETLGLPAAKQYRHYVDTGKPYVVWNVFAAPTLSLDAKTWCYPIAGCLAYRGYYKKESAQAYAKKLSSRGYDVYVGGVAAYSTLGWLNDPVLNTFVYRHETDLANLIFHELAHRLYFVPGDTVFNESFATVIAQEGVKRWYQAKNDPLAYQAYLKEFEREQAFVELVINAREELNQVYLSSASDAEKVSAKERLQQRLREDYKTLTLSWDASPYKGWFMGSLNNAQLNTVSTYYDRVPELQALLRDSNNDLQQFLINVKALNDKES